MQHVTSAANNHIHRSLISIRLGEDGRGGFTHDRQIAWDSNCSFMSQNALGKLFTLAVCHSSADSFTAMLGDYVTVKPRRLPVKINPCYGTNVIRSGPDFFFFFFLHNPGLCLGCTVVTSAFKTLTCVTGCAYVHTAQPINNNSYCADKILQLYSCVLSYTKES